MNTLKKTALFASIATLFFLVIANCGRKSPDAPPDVTPPMMIGQSPVYMAQNVPTGTAISATFSEDIDPATVVYKTTISLTYFDGPVFNVVEGTAACNGATITFTPGAPLPANTTFRFTLTPNIKDIAGNGYQGPLYEIVFTTGTGTATGTTHTVTASAGPNGSISPSGPVTVNDGAVGSFTVTPNAGYQVSSATGCGGNLAGSTYTTGPVTADCTVTVSFSAVTAATHTITASSGPNGAISPSGAVTVNHGATRTFTLSPASGYQISSVGGTCGGSLSGNTYTTNPVNADCTVTASFSLIPAVTHTVTASSTGHGSISPSKATVNDGSTATFTLRADRGYQISWIGGTCGGWLSGSSYTTNPVRADCTVIANFARIQATVTPSVSPAGAGTIDPGTPQLVYYEDTISFTVLPAVSYAISSVSGCGGTLAGNLYTTGLVTADCTVSALFTAAAVTAIPVAAAGVRLRPAAAEAAGADSAVTFTVTPEIVEQLDSVWGCGSRLAGNLYTTGLIMNDCSVTASFIGGSLTVTRQEGPNGGITPAGPQRVVNDGIVVFTLTPEAGYSIGSVSGCGGTLAGSVYTTGPIASSCTVSVTFSPTFSI